MALLAEPSAVMLNLSILAFLLGITTVTWCITRSLQEHQIWSLKTWSDMPWPRLCLLLVLLTSWLYLLLTGVLLFGAPPRHTEMRCNLGTMACILLYCVIKGLIYLCLVERVHAVWGDGRRRWHSPIYRFCLLLMIPLGAVTGLMLAKGVHYLHNGYCVIGIRHTASLVLLSYDIALNIFLTCLFVAPLVRSTIRSARLKAIAYKAMAATSIGLVITIVNGFVLYALGGEEIIWACLGGCAADVVINAVVMYWAMQSPARPKGSVHVSPLSLTNGARDQPRKDAGENPAVCGTRAKPTVCSFAMPTYEQQEDGLSNGTTMISTVSAPGIDIPQPIIRNPRHVDLYASHPSGSRLSLSLSAKRASRSENDEEADISLQELGLVRNHDDSGIYELKVRDASSEGN